MDNGILSLNCLKQLLLNFFLVMAIPVKSNATRY